MSEQANLQRARDLIAQKDYNNARKILLKMPDNPTAQKWLKKLDEMEIPPSMDFLVDSQQNRSKERFSSSNSDTRASAPRLTLLYVLNFIIVILFGLLFAGVLPIKVQFDEPIAVENNQTNSQTENEEQISVPNTVSIEDTVSIAGSVSINEAVDINGVVPVSISEPIEIQGPVPVTFDTDLFTSANAANANVSQQWEYLTVQYSQIGYSFDEDRAEFVQSNDFAYDTRLFGDLRCDNPFEIVVTEDCIEKFRGQAFYLNLWGNDGWELLSINDKSDSIMYSIEMIFKRPKSD